MMITIQMIQVHVDLVDDQNDNYEQVRLAFRTLDKDGSGTIETSEFKHLMTHIGMNMKTRKMLIGRSVATLKAK